MVPRFAFDRGTMYTIAPSNVIVSDDLYLLGIMNSTPSKLFFGDISIQRSGNYLEFKPIYVEQLPIPDASSNDREAIVALVSKCLDARGKSCEQWEHEIDERVARLYGLT